MAPLNILIVFLIAISGDVLCQSTTPALNATATDAATTTVPPTTPQPTTQPPTMKMNQTTPDMVANTTVMITTMAKGNATEPPATAPATTKVTVKPTQASPPNCTTDANCYYTTCDNTTKECDCDPFKPALKAEVCGTDGITYSTVQELEYKACMSNKHIKIDRNGNCEDEEKSNKKTIIIVIVILLIIIAIIVVAVVLYRRKNKQGRANVEEKSKDALL